MIQMVLKIASDIVYGLILGVITWIIGFIIVGYAVINAPELYITTVLITSVINTLIVVLVVRAAVYRTPMSQWAVDSFLIGITIMLLNFLLDFAILGVMLQQDFVNYLLTSTVLIAYPLAILWSLIGGWLGSLKL
ncbi:MAG: hypothetical protein ACFFCD_14055 [Promethearchaeota archaeon]